MDDLETRISILRMMYSVVRPLSDDVIYCEQGDKATIVNKNGIEIMSGDKDTLTLKGIFIVLSNRSKDKCTIYSFSTNTKMECKQYKLVRDISDLAKNYLLIHTFDSVVVYNKYLEKIFDTDAFGMKTIYGVKAYHSTDSKLKITYRLGMRNVTACLNTMTDSFEYYDSFNLDDDYSCIATEAHKYTGVSVNEACVQNYKYRLAKNGYFTSSKAYEDIVKPSELRNTNMFYTYDTDNRLEYAFIKDIRKLKGLLRSDGVELLEPLYDDIKYIGANNYILQTVQNDIVYTAIYNSENGVVYDFNQLIKAEVHQTLPLVIIFKQDSTLELMSTINGIRFNPKDLCKYFRCSYDKQRPDIIRIDLDYGHKYITNTLVPITNMHEISKLSTHEWVPMVAD